MMKRFTAMLLVLLSGTGLLLSGCSQPKANERTSVVCTIFPQYDWVRQILGDKADNMDITLLLDKKIDLHSYQPSVDDIVKISACDLFIYVGGESDGWVADALEEATNADMIVINLLDVLGSAAKAEEVIEGMEAEEPDGDLGEEPEYDEHVWLSLKNARLFCAAIADALTVLDPDNAGAYQSNLAAYIRQLSTVDAKYQATVDAAPVKTILVGDRFPFRYLADDYGLNYYAAFVGCSAETEASFETIVFLAKKADELHLKNILVTESSNRAIAETIRGATGGKDQHILVLNAMQSISQAELAGGATYLAIMESNLRVLKEALQ